MIVKFDVLYDARITKKKREREEREREERNEKR